MKNSEPGALPRRLIFSRQTDKFLDDIAPKQYKQIVSRIFALTTDPTPHDSETLKGHSERRLDSGEFRVVYEFDDDSVTIVLISKRNDDEVYKRLRRR